MAARDVADPPVARGRVTRGGRARHAMHGGGEIGDLAGREQRRERAPLDAPVLAVRCEQAGAEAGTQNAQLQGVLAIIGYVVEKDAPDRVGIVDHGAHA